MDHATLDNLYEETINHDCLEKKEENTKLINAVFVLIAISMLFIDMKYSIGLWFALIFVYAFIRTR